MLKRKRLGDMLLEMKYVTSKDVEEALNIQKTTGKKLGEIFIENGLITEEKLLLVLEKQLGTKVVRLDEIKIDNKAVNTIPEALARKYNLIPIGFNKGKLIVVMSDPLNILSEEDVSIASGYVLEITLSTKREINKYIAKCYSEEYLLKATEEMKRVDVDKKDNSLDMSEDEIMNSPSVKLIDTIIKNAVRNKASDIHIEPFEDRISVRYRLDGSLKKQFDSSKEPLSAMITRIKILSNMDISEKRLPQDGRIIMSVDGDDVDLRVSILPAINGEKVVIRILDREAFNLSKKELGIIGDDLEKINRIINRPYGIILVTGPTGSGKTTTLYSLLKDLNNESTNIITIEDPVEYTMDGITQVSVNTKAGLTFSSGLRSILRQDPDIVMLGEIRDGDTSDIAIRAAITGHLVLSTIHTNDAPSSIVRLKDMGVAPYLIASSLTGVIAQRLVRKVCIYCKESYKASNYEKEILGLGESEELILHKANGCVRCSDTGYKGRVGIYEVMELNKEIRELIYLNANVDKIKEVAINTGMVTLDKCAIKVVLRGDTTLEELMRVTMLEE